MHAKHVRVPGARRRHQHRFALGKRAVRVRAGLEKGLDQSGVAILRRERNRGDAITARGLHVGARGNQHLRHRDVVGADRPMERGHTVGLGRIHVGPLCDQRSNGRPVAVLHGVDQTNATSGGFETSHRQEDE